MMVSGGANKRNNSRSPCLNRTLLDCKLPIQHQVKNSQAIEVCSVYQKVPQLHTSLGINSSTVATGQDCFRRRLNRIATEPKPQEIVSRSAQNQTQLYPLPPKLNNFEHRKGGISVREKSSSGQSLKQREEISSLEKWKMPDSVTCIDKQPKLRREKVRQNHSQAISNSITMTASPKSNIQSSFFHLSLSSRTSLPVVMNIETLSD